MGYKLPKRSQPRAKQMLHPKGTSFRAHEIMAAESKENTEEGIKDFVEMYEEKYPKAVNNLTKDVDRLLTFFDFPAAHWKHIRSTNAIEYPKGRLRAPRLRLRQRVTKGSGSRIKALTMAFKLLDMAEKRWRRISAPHLVKGILSNEVYENGVKVDAA